MLQKCRYAKVTNIEYTFEDISGLQKYEMSTFYSGDWTAYTGGVCVWPQTS